ncbi:DNA polymerase beta superfamily protein [Oceanirhabdus seepicola]|uniref:Nucleotidyltransferase domain-containing protein n=1 Tax=Oceanirhabdus seepicola TaxID=2828781 RepID=A0A9J6P4C0_9CLOT|nr:nucleotidyltransferase domain-containing protein [Oceanirhabdus seepicola]MCM1991543.1 nucleotidyltransferase domain-containing protein [Oceanirhabdus seepicola]
MIFSQNAEGKFIDILHTTDYDFLKTNPVLNANIIYLTLSGSHAYGTNNEYSDIDIRGIFLNTKKELLTMECSDKPFEHRESDTVIYPLKQIIKLLSNCNPNCIELLGTKDQHVLLCSPEGKLIRDNAHIFLSKYAINTFGGYATAQLRRLQNALARDNYPKSEKERHILGSIQNQMVTFKDRYKEIDNNINLYIPHVNDGDLNKKDKEILIDINVKGYPLRDLKGMYSEMNNVIRDYDKLNHRNSKKDDLHLNKHALHLVRLLIMGTEILQGKGIHTHREQDHSLLMDLRNGTYVLERNGVKDYSEVFNIVDKYEKEFNYAKKECALPDKPDYDAINDLVMEITRHILMK